SWTTTPKSGNAAINCAIPSIRNPNCWPKPLTRSGRGISRSRWGRSNGATIPLLDTPIRLANAQPELITITDPAHPLHGRSFPLISVSGLRYGTGHAHVDDRGRAVLRIPIVATSLHPTPLSLPSSKLSLDAIRDLVRLASPEEGISGGQSRRLPLLPVVRPTPSPP